MILLVTARRGGMLDWLASFSNAGRHTFTLGCIQRKEGDQMEFHS